MIRSIGDSGKSDQLCRSIDRPLMASKRLLLTASAIGPDPVIVLVHLRLSCAALDAVKCLLARRGRGAWALGTVHTSRRSKNQVAPQLFAVV